jgi:hypothetical protein
MIVAQLVEVGSTEAPLSFHYNPTTYKIARSVKFDEEESSNSRRTSLQWVKTNVTTVTFKAFLDQFDSNQDVDRLIPARRSVESSLGWLMNRLNARIHGTNPGGSEQSFLLAASNNWRAASRFNADDDIRPPSILIFTGLGGNFVCRMQSCSIGTQMQDPGTGLIIRATVDIVLKEHVYEPAKAGLFDFLK